MSLLFLPALRILIVVEIFPFVYLIFLNICMLFNNKHPWSLGHGLHIPDPATMDKSILEPMRFTIFIAFLFSVFLTVILVHLFQFDFIELITLVLVLIWIWYEGAFEKITTILNYGVGDID